MTNYYEKFTPKKERTQEEILRDINRVIECIPRSRFMDFYHKNDTSFYGQLEQTLKQQEQKIQELHREVLAKDSDEDKVKQIMSIEHDEYRRYMVREYSELFQPKQPQGKIGGQPERQAPPVMIYDEESGLHLPEENMIEKKRKQILDIKDDRLRLATIQANPELFKNKK